MFSFEKTRDCWKYTDGRCIVTALMEKTQTASSLNASHADRANSIRMVIHLLADIHSPLHMVFHEDAGGVCFPVYLPDGTKTSVGYVFAPSTALRTGRAVRGGPEDLVGRQTNAFVLKECGCQCHGEGLY